MQTIGDRTPAQGSDRAGALVPIMAVGFLLVIFAGLLSLAGDGSSQADPQNWTPLQTANRFNALYESGRVGEFQALVSPDAEWCVNAECSVISSFFGSPYGVEFQTAHESQYLAATGGTLGAECEAAGQTVTCLWHQTNLLFEVGGIDPWVGPQTFTVEDGRITRYSGGYRYEGVIVYDRVQQNQYSDWLEVAYPHEHPGLFEDQLMLVFDEPNRERHLELITEWSAGLGY
jgi:hypothetical protein